MKKLTIPKITVMNVFAFVILLCMFLGAMDFINRYYYCVFIAFFFFVLTPKRNFQVNISFLILLVLSLSIMIFNPESHDSITDIIRPFSYPICYFMGLNIFNQKSSDELETYRLERNLSSIIYIMTLGLAIHFFLNMFTNINATDRDVVDFWTREAMSATGQATLACLMVAVIATFIFSKSGLFKKILALAMLAAIVAYNLILAGRTLFAFIAVMFVLAFVFKSIVTRKNIFGSVLLALLVIAVLLSLYNMNIFGIKAAFENSNFYDRFFGGKYSQDIRSDKRGVYKLAYLDHFFEHLFGGRNIKAIVGHSAHDLYLDTYDESGIFALIAVVAYIICSISRMFRFIKLKTIRFEIKQLVFCTYVIVNIQFWLEPIIRGMPWLLATYCFIDGALTYTMNKKELEKV